MTGQNFLGPTNGIILGSCQLAGANYGPNPRLLCCGCILIAHGHALALARRDIWLRTTTMLIPPLQASPTLWFNLCCVLCILCYVLCVLCVFFLGSVTGWIHCT